MVWYAAVMSSCGRNVLTVEPVLSCSLLLTTTIGFSKCRLLSGWTQVSGSSWPSSAGHVIQITQRSSIQRFKRLLLVSKCASPFVEKEVAVLMAYSHLWRWRNSTVQLICWKGRGTFAPPKLSAVEKLSKKFLSENLCQKLQNLGQNPPFLEKIWMKLKFSAPIMSSVRIFQLFVGIRSASICSVRRKTPTFCLAYFFNLTHDTAAYKHRKMCARIPLM